MNRALADLLDREAIRAVVHRNARGLDRIDDLLVLSCYWPEAVDDHSHFVGGPQDFAAYAGAVARSFVTCQHHITTHTCELAGDEAFAESYFTFTGTLAQPPHFLSTGRYVDHFQKRGDEWRILNRIAVVEASYGLPETLFGAGLPSPYAPGERFPGTRDAGDVSYHRPPVPRKPRQT